MHILYLEKKSDPIPYHLTSPPPTTAYTKQVKHARLQPSCSLQFLPWSVEQEGRIRAAHPLVFPLLSFALEKLGDLHVSMLYFVCVCVCVCARAL